MSSNFKKEGALEVQQSLQYTTLCYSISTAQDGYLVSVKTFLYFVKIIS